MKLMLEIKKCIEEKIRAVERKYGIKAMFWCTRGSMHAEIYRKNSDLDILYVFQKKGVTEINAVHDIVGYGFDLWGWNIEQVLLTVKQNLKQIYLGKMNYWVLSKEYRRGNLMYYGGIYCALGNENYYRLDKKWSIFENVLWNAFEPCILQMEFMHEFYEMKRRIVSGVPITFCDYLNTISDLLLLEHVLKGGMPGQANIYYLAKLYLPDFHQGVLYHLLSEYQNAIGKYEQRAYISELNELILERVERLLDIEKDSIKGSDRIRQSILNIELLYTQAEGRQL